MKSVMKTADGTFVTAADSERQELQEAASGGPGSITLGGRTFLVGQATDADLMAVRKRLKKFSADPLAQYASVVNDKRWRILPKKVRDEIAKEAGQLASRGEKALTPEMMTDMLMEGEHCRFLAWMLLRKCHPELTLEELTPLVNDDNAPVVFMELSRESGMDALGN